MSEKKFSCINIQTKDVVKKLYGEGSASIAKIFKKAAERERSILFFDEIDTIAGDRQCSDEAMRRLLNSLIVELSGLKKNDTIFISATNFPSRLDAAFKDTLV